METTVANGKVALVTGSAMGIGLACAEAFAKAGYITVLDSASCQTGGRRLSGCSLPV